MALLNQLLSEKDLAQMDRDQIDFLADRIDNILNERDIQALISSKLEGAVGLVAPKAKLLRRSKKK